MAYDCPVIDGRRVDVCDECGFNGLLVTLGQNICPPTSPKCSVCPVAAYCARVGVTRSR